MNRREFVQAIGAAAALAGLSLPDEAHAFTVTLSPHPSGDDTSALQAAVSSGASIVNLTAGTFCLSSTVTISGVVQIYGTGTKLTTLAWAAGTPPSTSPLLRITGGSVGIAQMEIGVLGGLTTSRVGERGIALDAGAMTLDDLQFTHRGTGALLAVITDLAQVDVF